MIEEQIHEAIRSQSVSIYDTHRLALPIHPLQIEWIARRERRLVRGQKDVGAAPGHQPSA